MPINNVDINSISPDIRDMLLNRNLILSDTITKNSLTSLAVGLGKPVEIDNGNNYVVQHPDIVNDGLFYNQLITNQNTYKTGDFTPIEINNIPNGNITNDSYLISNTLENPSSTKSINANDNLQNNINKNLYVSPTEQVKASLDINVQPVKFTSSYTDLNKNIQFAGISMPAANIIGSVLTGKAVGITNDGGIVPFFDLRASLAGRALGNTNDTPLGQAGARYLSLAIANNVAFNLQRETLGNININPLSLLMGGDIIVPDYSITVPRGKTAKIIDYTARILGIEVPISQFDTQSSIFNDENPIGNIERANAQINNTGVGQVNNLFFNINGNATTNERQRYRPGFNDGRVRDNGINPELYVFGDGKGNVIDLLNGPTNNPITQDNYRGSDIQNEFENLTTTKNGSPLTVIGPDGDSKFSWEDNKFNNTDGKLYFNKPFSVRKSILTKTQNLFQTGLMGTLVSGRFTRGTESEIESSVVNGQISKGSAVLGPDGKTFCRTWTTFKRYNKVNDLQKHRGLDVNGALRLSTENSVLQDNGFVKIAPEINPDGSVQIKNFMFSLENLAWNDNLAELPSWEIGPGDLLSETKGRIMWFPPYDLSISESNNVNLETTSFIGRGEPIYTYNNTERKGTLSFKVIVDYPTYLNDARFLDQSVIDSIIAGCTDIPSEILAKLSAEEKRQLQVKIAEAPQTKLDNNTDEKVFTVYFFNDSYNVNYVVSSNYEKLNGTPVGSYDDGNGQVGNDTNSFGLNSSFFIMTNGGTSSEISKFLNTESPNTIIEIRGYASSRGDVQSNKTLSTNRANAVKEYIKTAFGVSDEKRYVLTEGEGQINDTLIEGGISSKLEKSARKVDVIFKYSAIKNDNNIADDVVKPKFELETSLTKILKSRFFNESEYFYKLEQDSPTVFKEMKEKIKFFHPAFHSTTPEGLNSRLNFLLQCTRQGATTKGISDRPDNLAFGKAPVCILRIGDFYHTKIIMDNVSIDYEQNLWDLNPEGIGVQPMIANINIGFNFIGGSSLAGPINRLQNAVSFNFFANTGVYDTRADYIKDGVLKRGTSPFDKEHPVNSFIANGRINDSIVSNNTVVEKKQAEIAKKEASKESTTSPENNLEILLVTYSEGTLTITTKTKDNTDMTSSATGKVTLNSLSAMNNITALGNITIESGNAATINTISSTIDSGLYFISLDLGNGIILKSKLNVI
jgi:outer membrane protein OmpA-like peptidoglycan-associated protein